MTATLEGGEWSAARPGLTLPAGKSRYPFYRRLGGPKGRSGRVENLVPTGIRSRTVQPVVSRYTDWATGPTHICVCVYIYIYMKWSDDKFYLFSQNKVPNFSTFRELPVRCRYCNFAAWNKVGSCKHSLILRKCPVNTTSVFLKASSTKILVFLKGTSVTVLVFLKFLESQY